MAIPDLLRSWLNDRLEPAALEWLDGRLETVRAGRHGPFQLAFGMVPRKTGKEDLVLSPAELLRAEDARPGWDPSGWSVDHATRSLIVLSYPQTQHDTYLATLDQMLAAGEVSELVALYQTLPLLPGQPSHVPRAVEGLRTNIKPVFAAIAHRNPYPAEQFSQAQWNQMVLKALFVELPLWPIVGLDERINEPLMRMLCDYAHERWAAHRVVSPELWRCVGPVADNRALEDLAEVLKNGMPAERKAVALSLLNNEHAAARELLEHDPELVRDVRKERLTWESIMDDKS